MMCCLEREFASEHSVKAPSSAFESGKSAFDVATNVEYLVWVQLSLCRKCLSSLPRQQLLVSSFKHDLQLFLRAVKKAIYTITPHIKTRIMMI
jgi:hypothetical protein